MYLAARFGRWSTTVIGRFYNGRDHSTVCYGIQRIEALKDSDSEVDALLAELKQRLAAADDKSTGAAAAPAPITISKSRLTQSDIERIAELVAARVCAIIGRTIG